MSHRGEIRHNHDRFNYWGSISVSLGYIAAIMLIAQSGRWTLWFTQALSSVLLPNPVGAQTSVSDTHGFFPVQP